jgi:hypothetical protein
MAKLKPLEAIRTDVQRGDLVTFPFQGRGEYTGYYWGQPSITLDGTQLSVEGVDMVFGDMNPERESAYSETPQRLLPLNIGKERIGTRIVKGYQIVKRAKR